MSKSISILDKEYKDWILGLSQRYRRSHIKAAVKVNREMLKYYWSLGCDIAACLAINKENTLQEINLKRIN